MKLLQRIFAPLLPRRRPEPPPSRTLAWDAVAVVRGNVSILVRGGPPRRIVDLDRNPIRRFPPGWAARGALSFSSGAAIIDLVHANGGTQAWFVDQTGRMVTDRPWDPNEGDETPSHKAMRTCLAQDVVPVVDRFLETPKGALRIREVRLLMVLSRQNVVGVIQAAGAPVLSEAISGAGAVAAADGQDQATTVPAERISRIMAIEWESAGQRMFQTGRVVVPALTHDGDARRAVVIRCGRFEYVIHAMDSDNGPAWMAGIAMGTRQRKTSITWLLLPDRRSFVRGKDSDVDGDEIARQVVAAVSMYAGASAGPSGHILPLFEDTAKIALEFRPANRSHLGHLVWNHLSGVHRIVEACRESGQELLVYDLSVKPGADIYGPLERIFPELEGKVFRADTARSADLDVFAAAARRGHCLLPFRVAEVPASLRQRLRRSTSLDVVARAVEPFIDLKLPAKGDKRMPVLALGLRLQNRTVVNLLDVYTRVIRRLTAAAAPDRLCVLIDGMNVLPNGEFAEGAETLIDREKAFVDALRERVAGCGAEIISLVGMTMSENLAWLGRADVFVAPQGGGLTKLRWIHHKPGYVLTSATNLRLSTRTFLYGHRGKTESPLPMLSNGIEDVEDIVETNDRRNRPGTWAGGLSDVNFQVVRLKSVVATIEDLFRQTLASRAGAGVEANH